MGCPWWVLELNTFKEAEETRMTLEHYREGSVEKQAGEGVPTST
jgi:hypothetical protein